MTQEFEDQEEGEFQHSLPKNPVEIIQQTKGGTIRIPKEYRGLFKEEKPQFAFWKEGNRFIFHYITEEDIPNLNVQGDSASSKTGSDSQTSLDSTVKKSKKKPKLKIQPELTKYLPYQFEEQSKVAQIWESTFYKLAEDSPNMQEAIDRIKYAFMKFATGDSTNDSRLFNSAATLIFDVVKKMKKPEFIELIKFADEKILINIKSKFLLETTLINLATSSIILKDEDYMNKFIYQILDGIKEYNEIYAIIQGFKNLVNSFTNIEFELEIPERIKKLLLEEMYHYINGDEIIVPNEEGEETAVSYTKIDTDGVLRFIDLLEDLHLIEEALKIIQKVSLELEEQDPLLEEVRDKKKHLEKINI